MGSGISYGSVPENGFLNGAAAYCYLDLNQVCISFNLRHIY